MPDAVAFILRCLDAGRVSTVHLILVIDEDAEYDNERQLKRQEERDMPPVQHEMLRAHGATSAIWRAGVELTGVEIEPHTLINPSLYTRCFASYSGQFFVHITSFF